MNYLLKEYSDLGVSAEISALNPSGKSTEFQVMLHVTHQTGCFDRQLLALHTGMKRVLADAALSKAIPVFARCFLSDAANQQDQVSTLFSELLGCPVCYVKQPPLDGSKLALWLQLQTEVSTGNDGLFFYEHNGYRHYCTAGDYAHEAVEKGGPYRQTMELLEVYEEQLKARGCFIEKDCIRTWFFVRDVDINYLDVVEARKENFLSNGMSNQTHYITSTGIEGCVADPRVTVLMDTYAIRGVEEGQIQFLYANDHLSPTYDYGVTFERGVRLNFGDRLKVYLSGTASIDSKGDIVHAGDVVQQVHRTWTNVEALLKEAECSMEDIMQLIVYLRDLADYSCVNEMFDRKFPGVPKLIVLAPVCRPGWLVEMECIASREYTDSRFRDL